jgi:hypothetical protein
MLGDMYQQNQFVYRDQQGRLLAEGTVIEDRTSFALHQGIIAYQSDGQQIVLQNSKRFGQAVATFSIEFNGGLQAWIVRVPKTPAEGAAVVQRAWSEVQRGVKWTGLDNCQDFVSRAYTGQNGSKTRNVLLIGAAAALLFAFS